MPQLRAFQVWLKDCRCFKIVVLLLGALVSQPAHADHVPELNDENEFVRYQVDAGKKRYADILKIAALIEEFEGVTGALPVVDASKRRGDGPNVYELVVLGQSHVVDDLWEKGSPFGFSLYKYRGDALIAALEEGLGREIALPIDPQKVPTKFWPTYFVLFRAASENAPEHYIVLGTFGVPVLHGTEVAEGAYVVGVSNYSDLPFIADLIALDSIDEATARHIYQEGEEADRVFRNFAEIEIR